MEFKVSSGPTDVLLSGLAFSYQRNPIEIVFPPPPPPLVGLPAGSEPSAPPGLKIIFTFVDEPPLNPNVALASRIEAKVPNEFTLEFTLFNFGSVLGQGSEKPLEIGHMGGRAIYLHYRVYSLATSPDKELHFTIFQNREPLSKPQAAAEQGATGEPQKANG